MTVGIWPHLRVEVQEALLSLDSQLGRDRITKLSNIVSRSSAGIDMFEPLDDTDVALAKPIACLPFGHIGDKAVRSLWRRCLSIGRLWAKNCHTGLRIHTIQCSAIYSIELRIRLTVTSSIYKLLQNCATATPNVQHDHHDSWSDLDAQVLSDRTPNFASRLAATHAGTFTSDDPGGLGVKSMTYAYSGKGVNRLILEDHY